MENKNMVYLKLPNSQTEMLVAGYADVQLILLHKIEKRLIKIKKQIDSFCNETTDITDLLREIEYELKMSFIGYVYDDECAREYFNIPVVNVDENYLILFFRKFVYLLTKTTLVNFSLN